MFEVVILLVTAAMMVFGLWGTLSLTQVHISPEKKKTFNARSHLSLLSLHCNQRHGKSLSNTMLGVSIL